MDLKESDFVYPGSFLGYEEEFLAGENAYGDDGGNVNADSIGLKQTDEGNHEAKVLKATRNIKIVKKGCYVLGIVSAIRQNNALIQLKEGIDEDAHYIIHDGNASLAVFNISTTYIKSIDEMFRVGDILKAKVLDVTPYGIELETKDPECGVVKAYGVQSRKPLHLIDGVLRDPATGATETRKISSDYILR